MDHQAKYDIIIAGGGCSGLWLTYYLQKQAWFSNLSVLIIDRTFDRKNDRHWCFWGGEEPLLDEITCRSFPKMRFADREGDRVEDLGSKPYRVVRGIDFYQKMDQILRPLSNIDWLEGHIDRMEGNEVWVDGQVFQGQYIFDSCYHPSDPKDGRYHLLQHFKGWVIESKEASFDEDQMTLMDFSIPQGKETRFFYVLPFSKHKALIEFTLFSAELLSPKAYDQALLNYTREQLHLRSYQIHEEEFGVIPMTDASFETSKGDHIYRIGTKGGAVKPTTGYAFLRIQSQMKEMANRLGQAMENNKKITAFSLNNFGRFRFYDILLLHILQFNPKVAAGIFSALFRRNRFRHILQFLDERSSIIQEIRIFATLPKRPFLKALWKQIAPQIIPSFRSYPKKALKKTQIKLHNR